MLIKSSRVKTFLSMQSKFLPWAVLALLTLVGCSSPASHRDRQYSNNWDGTLTQRLEQGVVCMGDDRQMVYVAFGPPIAKPVLTRDNLERWQYLGQLQAMPPMLKSPPAGAVCFSTTNDVLFANPFKNEQLKLLVVEFNEQGKVANLSLFDAPEGMYVRQPKPEEYKLPDNPRPADLTH